MAFRLRVYAPTDSVLNLYITANGIPSLVNPAGTSTPCYDRSNVTTDVTISPSIATGYVFSRWVVTVDASTNYYYSEYLTLYYNASATNVFIRLETIQQTSYYANIIFDANGGYGAPSALYGQAEVPYITFTIPYSYPVRDGYTFLGWHRNPQSTAPEYYPGSNVTVTNVSQAYPGPTFTLYAVWKQETGNSGLYISNGSTFQKYAMYIYTTSWQQAAPYIYTNSWREAQ